MGVSAMKDGRADTARRRESNKPDTNFTFDAEQLPAEDLMDFLGPAVSKPIDDKELRLKQGATATCQTGKVTPPVTRPFAGQERERKGLSEVENRPSTLDPHMFAAEEVPVEGFMCSFPLPSKSTQNPDILLKQQGSTAANRLAQIMTHPDCSLEGEKSDPAMVPGVAEEPLYHDEEQEQPRDHEDGM